MYTPNVGKKVTVTLIPYLYFSPLAGVFEEIKVYVQKGFESPDPAKCMFWGYTAKGEDLDGDFKKYFRRSGKPININVDISGCYTATEERSRQVKAIREYLKTLEV